MLAIGKNGSLLLESVLFFRKIHDRRIMFHAHTITWIYNSELVKHLHLETEYWERKTKYDRKSNSKTNLEKIMGYYLQ